MAQGGVGRVKCDAESGLLFRIDELLNAQTTHLRAGLDYLRARAELQALTGEILPAYGLDLPS